MADFQEVRRDIMTFLMSLKNAVDRPFRTNAPIDTEERERFTRSMLMVEEARIRFGTYYRVRERLSVAEWVDAKHELLQFLNTFMHSPDVEQRVFDRRFRAHPVVRNDRERMSPFLRDIEGSEATIGDALIMFRQYIESIDFDVADPQGRLEFSDLTQIVPNQQVAPVRFQIVDDRIEVQRRRPRQLPEDIENIKAALEHIKSVGENLINNLEQSNCDRRLLDNVIELHSQISSEDNIVKIGLTNIACTIMCSQFQGELPDAINGMFGSYSTSISMYVAQFPEWEQFSQKAALVDLDDDDIADIDNAAGEIVAVLEQNPGLSSPEVPKTIKFVRELLATPGSSSRRAAFAMMRTIENLVASILRYSVAVIERTAEKTVDQVSTVAAATIVALLSVALVGATGIGAAAVNAGTPWVRQAAEVVQKQIERLNE